MRLSLGFSLVAVCVSIGSFVAVQLQSNPAPWEPTAANRFSEVLVALALALALVGERRVVTGAWQAQAAAAVVAVGFEIVPLVKLFGAPGLDWTQAFQWNAEAFVIGLAALAFGLIGSRTRTYAVKVACPAAMLVAVGAAIYALSLETDFRSQVWYSLAATAAILAASAAARMQTALIG
ncbi:MAG: hypothetical protein ACRDLM_10915 [Gaiellaceae bacterium]